ncbi:MAG: hypothetical protein MJ058_04310 [Akkermansia sp.]|nr:hypothetical protein [Akkermansia sp.]
MTTTTTTTTTDTTETLDQIRQLTARLSDLSVTVSVILDGAPELGAIWERCEPIGAMTPGSRVSALANGRLEVSGPRHWLRPDGRRCDLAAVLARLEGEPIPVTVCVILWDGAGEQLGSGEATGAMTWRLGGVGGDAVALIELDQVATTAAGVMDGLAGRATRDAEPVARELLALCLAHLRDGGDADDLDDAETAVWLALGDDAMHELRAAMRA